MWDLGADECAARSSVELHDGLHWSVLRAAQFPAICPLPVSLILLMAVNRGIACVSHQQPWPSLASPGETSFSSVAAVPTLISPLLPSQWVRRATDASRILTSQTAVARELASARAAQPCSLPSRAHDFPLPTSPRRPERSALQFASPTGVRTPFAPPSGNVCQ